MAISTSNLIAINGGSASNSLSSVLGVQIGKDTTKQFVASISGLAIKSGDRYLVPLTKIQADETVTVSLQDVTGCGLLSIDPCVYRVPVPVIGPNQQPLLQPGQLILVQESPVIIEKFTPNDYHIQGLVLSPAGDAPAKLELVLPVSVFGGVPFVTRILSLFDLLPAGFGLSGSASAASGAGFGNIAPLLPLLLGTAGKDSGLSVLLLAQLLGGGAAAANFNIQQLPLLLSLSGSGSSMDSCLELLLLSGFLTGSNQPPGPHPMASVASRPAGE